MTSRVNVLYGIILLVIAARIIAMITLPLTDTTEARYAHTAYLMAVTNDWVTPFYDVDIPFWGKPPFSFWAQAIAYKIFGIYDFSARVPAFIFTLLTTGLIFRYLHLFYNKVTALWGVIVYFTFLLAFALSGAVLTDPYLAFSTTLAMVSFFMVVREREKYWQYLFFAGLAIGLLAKGPLALVLVGGAITFWILFNLKERFRELKRFPWISGIVLTLVIALPWYVLAESKTPGFLDYFIIGEHFKRFIDPGWSGDLYGSAHLKAHGMIWLMWIGAAFPWILVVLYTVIKNSSSKTKIVEAFHVLRQNSETSYFVMWSIFTMTFFTSSGNVLWTYILPALPALAVLLAINLERANYQIKLKRYNLIYVFVFFVPAALLTANGYLIKNPNTLPTEKYLVANYLINSKPAEELYYLENRPFSAQYYSKDKAVLVSANEENAMKRSNSITFDLFQKRLHNSTGKSFIAIPKKNLKVIRPKIDKPMKKIFENKRYVLFEA